MKIVCTAMWLYMCGLLALTSGQPTVDNNVQGHCDTDTQPCATDIQVLYNIVNKLQHDNRLLQSEIDKLKKKAQRSCADLYKDGFKEDGVYTVYINGNINKPKSVYCDMTTNGGGWTVFQRRFDGLVDFYRNWQNYTAGFGDIGGEHWLGNEVVAEMTSLGSHVLRIDLVGFEGNLGWAEYTDFSISDESDGFRLSVNQYTGNMSDAIKGGSANHNGQQFSTFDKDNDQWSSNCAEHYHGAFWFHRCFDVHLNGRYSQNASVAYGQGIMWDVWKGLYYTFRKSAMKFRPADF